MDQVRMLATEEANEQDRQQENNQHGRRESGKNAACNSSRDGTYMYNQEDPEFS